MAVARGIVAVAVAAAVATVAGLAVARGGASSKSSGPSRAAAYADSLIDRVPLPKGATPFSAKLPTDLSADPGQVPGGIDNFVTRHRAYRVSGSYTDVFSAVRAHGVAGFSCGLSGESGPLSGPPTMFSISCDETRMPGDLFLSSVVISTAGDGGAESLLRIDAHVVWRPERTADEYVPATDRVVTIDRGVYPDGGTPTTEHRVVTDRSAVASLIRTFNHLPTMVSGGMSNGRWDCNDGVKVAFARSTVASPDLTVIAHPSCQGSNWLTWGLTDPGADLRPGPPVPVQVGSSRRTVPPGLSDGDGKFVGAVTAALGS